MWPGPNALADLLDCLLFWRTVKYAVMLDLKKAYQAIYTGEKELHLRRFLHRENPHKPWRTYGYASATFGDVSAGLVLEVAKRRVVNLGEDLDPMAAQQIKDNTFVDDSVLGGEEHDVKRMRGERTETGYSGTVAQILQKGGMKVKFMAITGTQDDEEERQLGGKTLGVSYHLKLDQVHFTLRPCYYSGKSSSADVARDLVLLTAEDI